MNKHRYVRLADLECNESHCDRDPALWTLCALPIEARCLYHEAADVAVNLAYEQGEIHRDDIGRFIETAVEVWENQAVPPTAFDDEAVEKVLNVLEANDG